MIINIDHIGIAVESLQEAVELYESKLGLLSSGEETIEEQGVKVAFFPIGDTEIELLEATAEGSPISNFIAKKGQGIHHISLRVENIEKAIELLKQKNVDFISDKPRYGAGGAKIVFLHPQSTNGVLIELSER